MATAPETVVAMIDLRPRIRCAGCRRRFVRSGWMYADYCWRCYYEDGVAPPAQVTRTERIQVHMEEARRAYERWRADRVQYVLGLVARDVQ